MKFNTRTLGTLFALVFSVTLSTTASANLVVNGSFEAPDIPDNSWSGLNPGSVPGWLADPANVEIWDSLNGVVSAEGEQHAELNSGGTGPFNLWQSFDTVAGQLYTFSFAHRARVANANEQFGAALFDGQITALTGFDAATLIYDSGVINNTSDWTYVSVGFVAVSDLTTLAFKSINPEGTVGNFIDDVSVVVSAPATLGLFSLMLAGFVAARRR
jgi:hypothetical protein